MSVNIHLVLLSCLVLVPLVYSEPYCEPIPTNFTDLDMNKLLGTWYLFMMTPKGYVDNVTCVTYNFTMDCDYNYGIVTQITTKSDGKQNTLLGSLKICYNSTLNITYKCDKEEIHRIYYVYCTDYVNYIIFGRYTPETGVMYYPVTRCSTIDDHTLNAIKGCLKRYEMSWDYYGQLCKNCGLNSGHGKGCATSAEVLSIV